MAGGPQPIHPLQADQDAGQEEKDAGTLPTGRRHALFRLAEPGFAPAKLSAEDLPRRLRDHFAAVVRTDIVDIAWLDDVLSELPSSTTSCPSEPRRAPA
jgi:hypothetical protein